MSVLFCAFIQINYGFKLPLSVILLMNIFLISHIRMIWIEVTDTAHIWSTDSCVTARGSEYQHLGNVFLFISKDSDLTRNTICEKHYFHFDFTVIHMGTIYQFRPL